MQPLVRALANQSAADVGQALNPLRLSYSIFADKNPWMKGVQKLAASVAEVRKPAAPDSPFLALQKNMSDQIAAALDAYRVARDQATEQKFFHFYGSPLVQGLLGLNDSGKARELPGTSPAALAARKAQAESYAAMLGIGGFNEALTRAVLYVIGAERCLDARCALALNAVRQKFMQLPIEAFKVLIRDQFFVLLFERDHAVEALAGLVRGAGGRKDLLAQVKAIVGAGDPPKASERARLARLAEVLEMPTAKLRASKASGRGSAAKATARLKAVPR